MVSFIIRHSVDELPARTLVVVEVGRIETGDELVDFVLPARLAFGSFAFLRREQLLDEAVLFGDRDFLGDELFSPLLQIFHIDTRELEGFAGAVDTLLEVGTMLNRPASFGSDGSPKRGGQAI